MYLSVRHRTGVEPHVNEVGLALHGLALVADEHDVVHIGAVQVNAVVVLLRHVAGHEALCLQRVLGHDAGLDGLFYLVVEFLD